MAPKKPTKTGGKAGVVPSRPGKPMAGLRDNTVRVPAEFNARTVDPTNQRGAGQRITGGLAGGRAGKPAGKIAAPAPKPAAKPAATKPATTTPRVRTTTSYGPPSSKVKFAGSSQSNPLSGIRNAATNAVNTVKNAASQVSKSGVGKNLTRLANNPAAKVLGRAAVVGGIVSELNQNLNPNSAMNKRDAELLRRIGNQLQGKPAKPAAKPTASTSRFAGARDKAMVKAKAIKGSPVLGPKKVGTGKVGTIAQAFDKSFASARKAGKATFMFRGKKYTTEMA